MGAVAALVERWTRNQGRPGSSAPLLSFRSLGIFVLSMMPQQGITFEKVRRVKNRSPKMMISRVASGLLN